MFNVVIGKKVLGSFLTYGQALGFISLRIAGGCEEFLKARVVEV